MNRLSAAGRVVFGTALIGLGLEPFLTGHLPASLVPFKSLVLPGFVACGVGGLLVLATIAATAFPRFQVAPLLLAAFPALALATVHIPRLVGEIQNPNLWSGVFQVVALLAGALLLRERPAAGRLVLGAALAVFGIQHFMYPRFIASLIPQWIPGRLFFAWATGAAFVAASVSALLEKYIKLSGSLLCAMLLSWVVVLHIPRILAGPGIETQWSSGFEALAVAGVGLLLAGGAE
jgi:uncharacterized membrane protein